MEAKKTSSASSDLRKGLLWRARADKRVVVRTRGGRKEEYFEDVEGGVGSSDDEDVDEAAFIQHYTLALEGEVPLVAEREASTRGESARARPIGVSSPAAARGTKRARVPPKGRDAFAFDEASQATQSSLGRPSSPTEGVHSPREATLNILDDPLASQASSFPFSQLPEVSFSGGAGGDDSAGDKLGLPAFLNDILDDEQQEGKGSQRGGNAPLMYELSQTDYLREDEKGAASPRLKRPSPKTTVKIVRDS